MSRKAQPARLTIILPASEKAKLTRAAKRADKSASVLLRGIIRNYLSESKNAKINS